MNHTVSHHPTGKHLPFLPSNFYKVHHTPALKSRINNSTKSGNGSNCELQVRPDLPITSSADSRSGDTAPVVIKKRRGRPVKVHQNSLKPYLATFSAPGHALAEIPQFDHIVTGAVYVDMGDNTRPLSKKVVIRMLQNLDVITAPAIREYMDITLRSCSVRHSQKIAEVLRIIERACSRYVGADWITSPTDATIEPCGNASCTVCSGTVDITDDQDGWSLSVPGLDDRSDFD